LNNGSVIDIIKDGIAFGEPICEKPNKYYLLYKTFIDKSLTFDDQDMIRMDSINEIKMLITKEMNTIYHEDLKEIYHAISI
jgi:hypothetical protein